MSEGETRQYFGKYRGTVLNNVDPMQEGRIMVQVADVAGMMPNSWATPCVPIAGLQQGTWMVPPIGALVWVEFEQGDPENPIWTGCFWGSTAEIPAIALAANPASPSIVLQSQLQHFISISDMPGAAGGILIKSTTGAMISVSDVGITISNGQGATINMTGPSVNINAGALVVT